MNVIANTNCSFCLIQLASKEKDNIKIYGKPVCNRKECIDKANAEAQTAAVSPRDRMVARLVRNGFVEQKTMRGFFILDGTTPIGADINNLSDVFPDMPQIGVLEKNGTILEEGHGIRRIDDIRRDIEGMLKSKPAPKATKSKDEKKPEKTEAGKAPQAGECKAKGTEVEGEVKKMEPKKEEKGLVTAYDSYDVAQEESSPVMKKPMTDAERDAQIELAKAKKFLEGRGSNYSVQGKERPDAHKIQQIANERGISIEIISAVQTDTYSDIVVRGHLGDQYIDACVHHDFPTESMLKMMEIIKKNPDILDHYDGIAPVIKEGAKIKDGDKTVDAKYYLVHTLLSFKKFSLRDARTKAASIAEAMLLNRDWRDDNEVQSELSERAIVEESIKNRR